MLKTKRARNRSNNMKWTGSTTCDICCKDASKNGAFFFDARVNWWPNAWAILCLKCVEGNILGLGEGQGQQYRSEDRTKVDPPTFNVRPSKPNPIDALL